MHLTKVVIFLFAICALALASPNPNPPKPKPSKAPPPPPPPPKCSGVELCCQSLSDPGLLGLLLELLGIILTSTQKNELCGQTCSPDSASCFGKKVCCDKQFEGGILAIGCKEL